MALTSNIILRRADYSSPGVQRTTTATAQNTITRIDLLVDKIQMTVNREVRITSQSTNPTPFMTTNAKCKTSWTMVGTIQPDTDNNIDAMYKMWDLEYACKQWYSKGSGGSKGETVLYWNETKELSAADKALTWTGRILKFVATRDAGAENQFTFVLQFVEGT